MKTLINYYLKYVNKNCLIRKLFAFRNVCKMLQVASYSEISTKIKIIKEEDIEDSGMKQICFIPANVLVID